MLRELCSVEASDAVVKSLLVLHESMTAQGKGAWGCGVVGCPSVRGGSVPCASTTPRPAACRSVATRSSLVLLVLAGAPSPALIDTVSVAIDTAVSSIYESLTSAVSATGPSVAGAGISGEASELSRSASTGAHSADDRVTGKAAALSMLSPAAKPPPPPSTPASGSGRQPLPPKKRGRDDEGDHDAAGGGGGGVGATGASEGLHGEEGGAPKRVRALEEGAKKVAAAPKDFLFVVQSVLPAWKKALATLRVIDEECEGCNTVRGGRFVVGPPPRASLCSPLTLTTSCVPPFFV